MDSTQHEMRQLDDKEIADLLTEALKKLESTANQDSKLLSDMNNALNWILTLTTVLFVFYDKQSFIESNCFYKILPFLGKFFFITLIFLLIVHKISLIFYERSKTGYLESLRTHYIELKFNLELLKTKFDFIRGTNLLSFINKFRDGLFIPYPNDDPRPLAFAKFDRSMKFFGRTLKISFWTGIVVFFLYFIELIIVLTQN